MTLSDDKKTAAVGPGNNCGQVYWALELHGLATLGGRASDIGTGGLTTGGGISYYSSQYRWVLDNVVSFEVVTASGIIVTASAISHPDLYWALRGGGNNVGLVTKFNFYTIPSPKMRGGSRIWTQQHFHPVIEAFVDVIHDAPNDPYAQYYIAFVANQGVNLASAELTYTKDVADPPIFREWNSIPAVMDTVASKTLVQQCDDIEAVNTTGLREVYWPISAHLNADFAKWAVDHFFKVLPQTSGVKGANPALIYQPLTQPILANMTKYGGNTLGLSTEDGPVHLLHIACWWDNADDDDTIYQFINDYWTTVIGKAKEMGIFNEWIYMNYASKFQDVIAGYGDANKHRLQ